MGTPPGLHHVLLADERGQTGGGSTALHVDQDAGRLQHDAQAQVFHHEGETGATGGCHRLGAGPRGTENGVHRGQFVLHLDIDAADLRQTN